MPENKKPSIVLCDLNDVTLGSSAIFENLDPKEVPEKMISWVRSNC